MTTEPDGELTATFPNRVPRTIPVGARRLGLTNLAATPERAVEYLPRCGVSARPCGPRPTGILVIR